MLVKAVVVVGGFKKVFDIVAAEGRLQLAKYAVSGISTVTLIANCNIFFTRWRTPSGVVSDVFGSDTVYKCFDLGLLS